METNKHRKKCHESTSTLIIKHIHNISASITHIVMDVSKNLFVYVCIDFLFDVQHVLIMLTFNLYSIFQNFSDSNFNYFFFEQKLEIIIFCIRGILPDMNFEFNFKFESLSSQT